MYGGHVRHVGSHTGDEEETARDSVHILPTLGTSSRNSVVGMESLGALCPSDFISLWDLQRGTLDVRHILHDGCGRPDFGSTRSSFTVRHQV